LKESLKTEYWKRGLKANGKSMKVTINILSPTTEEFLETTATVEKIGHGRLMPV